MPGTHSYNGGMSGTWSTEDINGRPADVYEPISRPRYALLYLHDIDGRKRSAPFAGLVL